MNLPIQARPVTRAIANYGSESPAGIASGSSAMPSNGIAPSEYGIEPSFGWGDLLNIGKQVLPHVLNAL